MPRDGIDRLTLVKKKYSKELKASDEYDPLLDPLVGSKNRRENRMPKPRQLMKVLSEIEADLTDYIADLDTLAHNINTLATSRKALAGAKRASSAEVQSLVDRCRDYSEKITSCLRDLEGLKKTKQLKGAEGKRSVFTHPCSFSPTLSAIHKYVWKVGSWFRHVSWEGSRGRGDVRTCRYYSSGPSSPRGGLGGAISREGPDGHVSPHLPSLLIFFLSRSRSLKQHPHTLARVWGCCLRDLERLKKKRGGRCGGFLQ